MQLVREWQKSLYSVGSIITKCLSELFKKEKITFTLYMLRDIDVRSTIFIP